MVFWLIVIALAILLFIRSRKEAAAKKAAYEAKEADRKELFSRLKSIDKSLSKIRGTLKDIGKEEENEGESEEEINAEIQPVKSEKTKNS